MGKINRCIISVTRKSHLIDLSVFSATRLFRHCQGRSVLTGSGNTVSQYLVTRWEAHLPLETVMIQLGCGELPIFTIGGGFGRRVGYWILLMNLAFHWTPSL